MKYLSMKHRKQRLKDFEKRLKADPTDVMINPDYKLAINNNPSNG
jgi:hypothetical protein